MSDEHDGHGHGRPGDGQGAPEVEVRVVDSTADVRYIVVPRRPAGTEGMGEAELAELVTRDSMIGVAVARSPAAAAR
jgi:nitrile hydratase